MQTNFNTTSRQNPQFGALKVTQGVPEALKSVFKPKDWAEFKEIINKQKDNPVDILIHNYNDSNKIYGSVVPNNEFFQVEDYSQRIFESAIGFIKRIAGKADQVKAKIDEIPTDIEDILKSVK